MDAGGSGRGTDGEAVIDVDKYVERAAIMEYDAGLSRFQAETQAAQEQGAKRWEANKCLQQARF